MAFCSGPLGSEGPGLPIPEHRPGRKVRWKSMSEEKKVRHSRDRDRRENHDNDVELRPMEKDGDKL